MKISLKKDSFRLFALFFFFAFCNFSHASSYNFTVSHPKENRSYKDSFYFAYGNTKYLAVSDLERGGVSLLKAYGNNDKDYRFHKRVIKGNHWAPTVVSLGGGDFIFVTSSIANVPSNSRLKYFTFNVNTSSVLNEHDVNDLNLSGGEPGMIDAYIWYESSKKSWYLMGSKWQPGVLGSRLQWAKLERVNPLKFSFPVDLYNTPNGYGIWHRVDWWKYNSRTDWVVEAPIRSVWNGKLYWSIGPSFCNGSVTGTRHGAIKWTGITPWIAVDNELMVASSSSQLLCNLVTHPDFTENGKLRATSYQNGKYRIINQN